MSKSTDLIPEQPKPKADVKEVLADKTKAANTGQVVLKGSPKSAADKYFDSQLKTGSF